MMVALLVTFAASVVLAWGLTWKRPEHRPVALLLSVGLAADVGRHVYDLAVLGPLRDSLGVEVPWTGWARVAALVAHALTLVWPAAIVAAVLVVFAGRKPWVAIIGWVAVLAVLAVAHPLAESQARALSAVQILAVVISAGIVIAWYLRSTKPSGSARLALALIVSAETISLFGAWRVGLFDRWPVSQLLYLALFGVLVVAQGRFLWNSPQPSS
jgi:hypothetical protein